MPDAKGKFPAIVFVHGIGGSARVWAPQVASFAAAGYAPVALDLPGYGGRPPVAAMDFENLAGDVEARIAERGLHRPVLVGHSMGGMIVQTALRRRPDGYAAVVLACTSPAFGSADGAFQTKFVADRLGPLGAGKTMAELAPGMVKRMIGPAADPDARAPSRSWPPCRPRPIAPRCAALSISTSAPTSAASRYPCFALPARRTRTRRRR